MVAMLLPCTYSMAAQNWPSITPAPKTGVMLGLLMALVLSASASSACSSAAELSPNAFNWITFRAIVCPPSGSLALYTAPVGDFASSLRISKGPMFVDIFLFPLPRESAVIAATQARRAQTPEMGRVSIALLGRTFELPR